MNIHFIGGGNMASALIGGLLGKGFAAGDIRVTEPLPQQRLALGEKFGIDCLAETDAATLDANVLVLAVKPQQMQAALAPIAGRLQRPVVLSIAAGLTLGTLSAWLLGYRRIVRAMPNTPALIGAGMSGLFALPEVTRDERRMTESVLAAAGETLWVEKECQMDAITAISGSGPAYFFLFLETLEEAAQSLGLSRQAARKLALQTGFGAASLAKSSPESPSALRARVTSKGGTTAAALAVMEEMGVAAGVIAGARAACARSAELARQSGTQGSIEK
ncbi:MAG: pyrroline-5-carboxylate reductase [Zoogloeaceae bacterium]|jgi:pyrroline-5-carboxylate reductase|nr:pyrroline-5-carboxylate reductase [Zoogloeaceae bacterium]